MAKLAMTSPLSNSEKNKRLQRELTEHARSHFAITFSETSLLDVVSKIDDVIDEVDQYELNFFFMLERWYYPQLTSITNYSYTYL